MIILHKRDKQAQAPNTHATIVFALLSEFPLYMISYGFFVCLSVSMLRGWFVFVSLFVFVVFVCFLSVQIICMPEACEKRLGARR
jgi:hypothetical protein